MRPGITVLTPTIPGRAAMLGAAVASAVNQLLPPAAVLVEVDAERAGAAHTRNRAIERVDTEWVAFLDDDDRLEPHHLQALMMHQETTGADLVYPWFTVLGGTDPLAVPVDGELRTPFQVPFGREQREHLLQVANFIPVTFLVRTQVLHDVGGFPIPGTEAWPNEAAEDWGLLQKIAKGGWQIEHLPMRTWIWVHHASNTSGRGHG